MISSVTPTEDNDFETSDNILQIGLLLGRNWVKWEFQSKFPKYRSDENDTKTEKKNDDLKACDSILQIGHLLGRNGVEWRFNFYYSKMLLWW